VPPPGNPQDVAISQQACNIAAYLANDIIKASIQKAVDGINGGDNLLATALIIFSVIPLVDIVSSAVVAACAILFRYISGSTLSDFTTALADAALWSDVQCAIFGAISADGFVTSANFASVVAAVGGVSYPATDVITSMVQYMNGLGADGVMAIQLAGSLYQGDCSACDEAGWCYEFSPANSDADFSSWTVVAGGGGVYVPGTGWNSTPDGSGHALLSITKTFASTAITSIEVFWSTDESGPGGCKGAWADTAVDCVSITPDVVGVHDQVIGVGGAHTSLTVHVDEVSPGDNPSAIQALKVRGTGVCPFGAPNC
jgi:hypothetical protein